MLQAVPGTDFPILYIKLDENLIPCYETIKSKQRIIPPEFDIKCPPISVDIANKSMLEQLKLIINATIKQNKNIAKIIVTFRKGDAIENSMTFSTTEELWIGRYSIIAIPRE